MLSPPLEAPLTACASPLSVLLLFSAFLLAQAASYRGLLLLAAASCSSLDVTAWMVALGGSLAVAFGSSFVAVLSSAASWQQPSSSALGSSFAAAAFSLLSGSGISPLGPCCLFPFSPPVSTSGLRPRRRLLVGSSWPTLAGWAPAAFPGAVAGHLEHGVAAFFWLWGH